MQVANIRNTNTKYLHILSRTQVKDIFLKIRQFLLNVNVCKKVMENAALSGAFYEKGSGVNINIKLIFYKNIKN